MTKTGLETSEKKGYVIRDPEFRKLYTVELAWVSFTSDDFWGGIFQHRKPQKEGFFRSKTDKHQLFLKFFGCTLKNTNSRMKKCWPELTLRSELHHRLGLTHKYGTEWKEEYQTSSSPSLPPWRGPCSWWAGRHTSGSRASSGRTARRSSFHCNDSCKKKSYWITRNVPYCM